jgi:hypothetical protein
MVEKKIEICKQEVQSAQIVSNSSEDGGIALPVCKFLLRNDCLGLVSYVGGKAKGAEPDHFQYSSEPSHFQWRDHPDGHK